MQFEMGRKCTPHKRAATGPDLVAIVNVLARLQAHFTLDPSHLIEERTWEISIKAAGMNSSQTQREPRICTTKPFRFEAPPHIAPRYWVVNLNRRRFPEPVLHF